MASGYSNPQNPFTSPFDEHTSAEDAFRQQDSGISSGRQQISSTNNPFVLSEERNSPYGTVPVSLSRTQQSLTANNGTFRDTQSRPILLEEVGVSTKGTVRRMFWSSNGGDDDPVDRIIYLNDPIKNKELKFLHNSITTAKYSLFTFVPKFLYEQFSKYANLFFLFTAVIQQIGNISPTNKMGTALPLGIVILASGVKELIEDFRRHSQDSDVNARMVKVLAGTEFVEKQWREVQVGDICRIENSQFFPADIVLLSSSEPDALAYIETSNLDGETNLKIRQGLPETANMLTPHDVSRLEGVIKSELPNNSLYTFEATLRLKERELALEPTQLLLRGAQLRNTRWAYGIVVFTGHETKLMRNSTATPIKRTKVERQVNTQIVYLFCILLTMSIICSFGYLNRQLNGAFEKNILMQSTSEATLLFFSNILTFIILFNNLIPLSLIVTMEMVKYAIGMLINSDLDMYHAETDTPATARMSSLVEELGQIDFIFSDKTGTLTCNIMDFKMCTIAGIAYAETVPEDKKVR
ncbi:hypothetical protein HK096_005370, partial [Nowakowskiella sp. JEL0078]